MNITIHYEGWTLSVTGKSVEVTTADSNEVRLYTLPELPVRIGHENEYVFLYFENEWFYQFKFEDDMFLVGDIFDHHGDFVNTFGCYVFGEGFSESMG